MDISLSLIGNWTKIGVFKICRLTQRNIRASRLDLGFCWRNRELEVSLEVGCPLCLVTVRKVPSSMDFMSTLRSPTWTLLGPSLQPSTKPWSILLVQHLLNWLLMLPSAPWRPWKFVSKLSLGSPEVYQMGFPSSSSLKEFLGMELCKTFWLCYVYGITRFWNCSFIIVWFCSLYKGLVPLWGRQIPCKLKHFHCFMLLVLFWFILSISSGMQESFGFIGLWTYWSVQLLFLFCDWLKHFVVIWFKKCFLCDARSKSDYCVKSVQP